MNSLEQQIASYTPSDSAIALVRSTPVILLVGISGAGKDTIKKCLLEQKEFRDIISHTTRAPRINDGVMETPDVDYHFIDDNEAQAMLADREFIEAKFVHGTVYGTSVEELQVAHDTNRIAITDLDVQGVNEYLEISDTINAIFIIPPSYEAWRQRLSKRYATSSEFDKEWPKRRDSAVKEIRQALSAPQYIFVENNDLSNAVEQISEVARTEKGIHSYSQVDTRHSIVLSQHESARNSAIQLLSDIETHI